MKQRSPSGCARRKGTASAAAPGRSQERPAGEPASTRRGNVWPKSRRPGRSEIADVLYWCSFKIRHSLWSGGAAGTSSPGRPQKLSLAQSEQFAKSVRFRQPALSIVTFFPPAGTGKSKSSHPARCNRRSICSPCLPAVEAATKSGCVSRVTGHRKMRGVPQGRAETRLVPSRPHELRSACPASAIR
jgi:hypothetical protein